MVSTDNKNKGFLVDHHVLNVGFRFYNTTKAKIDTTFKDFSDDFV